MLARAFIIIWILLSPNAMDAFGKITGSQIVSGAMDLDSALTGMIYAVGKKDGQTWDIEAKWQDGRPMWIKFSNPQAGT